MEDCNMIAADCVVISCCCQCLILQITIFILYKLPCKLIRKTREYTMKKLQQRRRKEIIVLDTCKDVDFASVVGESMRSSMEAGGGHSCRRCMEEVEEVLQEFSQRGEFGFGSFWGRGELGCSPSHHSPNHDPFDTSFVQYHLIEMVALSSIDHKAR
ncbi:uncharacterized protein LOC103947329 [Pyrus x bretschneideri]|uniref:uncharacterized protein LOC103947329 n=1 Tax=Pyrus x bretschneideri TaxID=225117 RepID=UPI0005119A37|nr:uncharacterized protein LOC103947329 [Pyrus x bretschneideri]